MFEVGKLRCQMLRHPLLADDPEDTVETRQAKRQLKAELSSIESTQFLLCEWSKIVTYLLTGSKIYERKYWSLAELQNPDSWEDSDIDLEF